MNDFLKKRWPVFALAGILILAGFFRIWQLSSLPPGLYSDEAAYAFDAVKTLESGDFRVFYPDNNGREGLYIWILALVFKFFGIGIVEFRLVGALAGIATVAATYFLARELWDERRKAEVIALASSFFLAASFWHINFSRIGFRAILMPLFLVLSFYLLVRAFKNKRAHVFIVTGFVFGLGFYTYTAFRMALFVFIGVFFFEFIRYLLNNRVVPWGWANLKSICFRDAWWKLGLFTITFLFVLLPLLFYFIAHPEDFSSRASGVFVFSKENPLKEFAISMIKTLGMFHVKGDMNWRHNFAGQPQLFFPVGILFLAGFFISLKELFSAILSYVKNKKEIPFSVTGSVLLVMWFFFMLLPATLTWEGIPHALRSIGVIPAVYIIAGIGFWGVLVWLNDFSKRKVVGHATLVVFVGAVLLTIGFIPFDTYRSWGEKPEVREAFSKKLFDIGEYLTGDYPGTPDNSGYTMYVVDEEGPWEAGNSIAIRPIRFLAYKKVNVSYIFERDIPRLAVPEDQQIVVMPTYHDSDIYRYLLSEYGERLKLTVYNKFIVIRINSL